MNEDLKNILANIRGYYRQKHIAAAIEGAGKFIILSSAYFFAVTVFEAFFATGELTRAILFFSWLLLTCVSAFLLCLIPLFKSFKKLSEESYIRLAAEIGKYFPEIKDKLANSIALQFRTRSEIPLTLSHAKTRSPRRLDLEDVKVNSLQGLSDISNGTEDVFSTLAFLQTANLVKGEIFSKRVPVGPIKRIMKFAVPAAVLSLLIIVSVTNLRLSAGRLFLFSRNFTPPARFIVNVLPGNISLTKGNDLSGKVIVFGGSPKEVTLYSKTREESEFVKMELKKDSTGDYSFKFPALHSDIEYYGGAEEVLSSKYTVSVFDRPVIRELKARVWPPSYSKLPPIEQIDNGSFSCLAGSNVGINIVASAELSSADLIFGDTLRLPLKTNGMKASGDFSPKKDMTYKLVIRDKSNNANENPVTYSIKLFFDASPVIELLQPTGNTLLESDQRNIIISKISDDYGFSDLKLFYRLSKSDFEKPETSYHSIVLPIDKSKPEQISNYIWNLAPLSLAAGDAVSYYLEVADNDIVNGPKKARTAELTVRQPSIDEIARNSEDEQNKVEKEVTKAFKEAEELKKEIESISKDLLKDKKSLTWEEKERIQNAAKKFEDLKEQVNSAQEQLKNTVKDMQKNNLLSKETMEKFNELQKLLSQLNSDELKKALERLQQNLPKMDRKQSQMDMENLKMNEEMFQKSLERTMNLLKRIQIEQKLDELTKRAETLQKQQESLTEKTEKSKNGDEKSSSPDKIGTSDLKKQQDALTKQLEEFKKDLQELSSKMNEFKDLPNDEAKKVQKEFQDQKNEELSEEAEKSLEEGMKQEAMQKQKQISKQMSKMSKSMKSLQNSMMQKQQMKVFADMMKLINEMLELSERQEELKSKSAQGEKDISFGQNARKQEDARSDLENIIKQLSQLSQKTFAISPEMGKELGDAQKNMQQAIQSLQDRNSGIASEQQAESMKSINEAAKLMKESAESMMQGGGQGGGSMMSLMQQLGKLSGQQMSLNNMGQKMMQGNSGELSPEQMGMMERIQQQQQAIQKSLKELNNEAKSAGNSKRLAGNLDRIAGQMEEVINDMKTSKLNDNILQKQERILSRMLDAQLSMNERDYEKERESNSGKNLIGKSPAELKKQTDKNDKMRDQLINSTRDAYLKDYEAYIRKYLEKVSKEIAN